MPFDMHRMRFMFSDGQTLDVLSPYTDSRVNDFAYLTHYGTPAGKGNGADRIVGSVDLGRAFGPGAA